MSAAKDRKWKITKWRFVVDVAIIAAAIGMAFKMKLSQPAVAFLIAGVADMTANLATYTTGNVVQKGVISKHFVPQLHEEEPTE